MNQQQQRRYVAKFNVFLEKLQGLRQQACVEGNMLMADMMLGLCERAKVLRDEISLPSYRTRARGKIPAMTDDEE